MAELSEELVHKGTPGIAGFLVLFKRFAGQAYGEMWNLLLLAATIALTSVSCERAFSALKRIKDYIRATMGQTRLTALMVIYVERKMLQDLINMKDGKLWDEFADAFTIAKVRHLDLPDPKHK